MFYLVDADTRHPILLESKDLIPTFDKEFSDFRDYIGEKFDDLRKTYGSFQASQKFKEEMEILKERYSTIDTSVVELFVGYISSKYKITRHTYEEINGETL